MDQAPDLSAVATTTAVGALVTPAGFVDLFTPDGELVRVRADVAESMRARLGLVTEQYDLATARAEWHASYLAAEDTVLRAVDEIAADGFQRDATVQALVAAVGAMQQGFDLLYRTVNALYPMESLIAAGAEHALRTGSLDAVPGLKAHADTIAHYVGGA